MDTFEGENTLAKKKKKKKTAHRYSISETSNISPSRISRATLVITGAPWKEGGGGKEEGRLEGRAIDVRRNGGEKFRFPIDPAIRISFGETYPVAAGGRNFRNIRPTNHSRPSNQPARTLISFLLFSLLDISLPRPLPPSLSLFYPLLFFSSISSASFRNKRRTPSHERDTDIVLFISDQRGGGDRCHGSSTCTGVMIFMQPSMVHRHEPRRAFLDTITHRCATETLRPFTAITWCVIS